MSAAGVEDAVEQIRVDEAPGPTGGGRRPTRPGLFDLTEAEASALAEALRLDVGDAFDDPPDAEVVGFGFGGLGGMSLDNLIGVGRQLGVQSPGGAQGSGWIDISGRTHPAGSSGPAPAGW